MSLNRTQKLDALTSLRFAAAFVVVIYHFISCQGQPITIFHASSVHAVTFFFMLSGFILYYAHPTLEGPYSWLNFWRARFARVFPMHLASLMLLLILSPYHRQLADRCATLFAANVALVNAWYPTIEWQYSFVSPSWSLCVEMFFYTWFPLLVLGWRRTWWLKLGLAFLLLAGVAQLAEYWQWPWMAPNTTDYSLSGLMYTNPLPRLFEFTLGMTIGHFFQWLSVRGHWGRFVWTVIEVAVIAWVMAVEYYNEQLWISLLSTGYLNLGWSAWIHLTALALPGFAMLILVMGLQRGWVSWLLSHKLPVLLGEISFSVYVIHIPLLIWCLPRLDKFAKYGIESNWLRLICFSAAVIVASYFTWMLIEKPARKLIVGIGKARKSEPVVEAPVEQLPLKRAA